MRGKKLLILMRDGVICMVFSVMVTALALMSSSYSKTKEKAEEIPADYKPINLKVNIISGPTSGYWEHCFKPLFIK